MRPLHSLLWALTWFKGIERAKASIDSGGKEKTPTAHCLYTAMSTFVRKEL